MSTFLRYSLIASAFFLSASVASAQSDYAVETQQEHQTTSVQPHSTPGQQSHQAAVKPKSKRNHIEQAEAHQPVKFGPEFFDQLQKDTP